MDPIAAWKWMVFAGVQDRRFQELLPDVLHWFGVTRMGRFDSMDNMKYDAMVNQGIRIGDRIAIPKDYIPEDAKVEMDAKKATGCFTGGPLPSQNDLTEKPGRSLDDF